MYFLTLSKKAKSSENVGTGVGGIRTGRPGTRLGESGAVSDKTGLGASILGRCRENQQRFQVPRWKPAKETRGSSLKLVLILRIGAKPVSVKRYRTKTN